jgi:hypothetical protein
VGRSESETEADLSTTQSTSSRSDLEQVGCVEQIDRVKGYRDWQCRKRSGNKLHVRHTGTDPRN